LIIEQILRECLNKTSCFCVILNEIEELKVFNVLIFLVNGDTLFMTGNFKEFKVESQENNTWDENNAMTSTAVCIYFP
jgi:hypothetical protein